MTDDEILGLGAIVLTRKKAKEDGVPFVATHVTEAFRLGETYGRVKEGEHGRELHQRKCEAEGKLGALYRSLRVERSKRLPMACLLTFHPDLPVLMVMDEDDEPATTMLTGYGCIGTATTWADRIWDDPEEVLDAMLDEGIADEDARQAINDSSRPCIWAEWTYFDARRFD